MPENPYSAPRTTGRKQGAVRLTTILIVAVVGIMVVVAMFGTYVWFLFGPTRPPTSNPQQMPPNETQSLSELPVGPSLSVTYLRRSYARQSMDLRRPATAATWH